MVATHSVWVHAISAVARTSDTHVIDYDKPEWITSCSNGDGIRVFPVSTLFSSRTSAGTVFFAIPTPVILNDQRLRASGISLHFRTGKLTSLLFTFEMVRLLSASLMTLLSASRPS